MPGGAFGGSLEAGDLNGDGFDDVIVGAPSEGNSSGVVFVFTGSANPAQLQTSTVDAVEFRGEGANDLFGDLQRPVDANGDGLLDLCVYAPANVDGGAASGKFYVFAGAATLVGRPAADADVIVAGQAGDGLAGGL